MRNDASSALSVDVRGMSMSSPRVQVNTAGRLVEFRVSEAFQSDGNHNLGAFFSKSVLSDAVFCYPKARRFAVLSESPIDPCYTRLDEVTKRFSVIYTHQQYLLAKGPPFLPLMFGTNWLGLEDDGLAERAANNSLCKTSSVSFIGSLEHPANGAYKLRREVAQYVMARGDVACFGKGIRPIAGKREAIAPFRFSIAMENASADHYFSEKLIDCLLLETVPIYFGCPGIGVMFDKRGFLCFENLEQLTDILDGLSVARYEEMRPFVLANKRKAIEEQWHSHGGLFARLAATLTPALLASSAGLVRPSKRLFRVARKTWESLV